MIDFTLSPSQQQIRKEAARFADQVLKGAHAVYSKHTSQSERFRCTRQFYRLATAGGMIAAQIPKALGGTNESLVDAAITLEEMFAADTSVTLTIAATGLGLTPLILSGDERLQKEYLKPFLGGGGGEGEPLASLVHSEPGGTANWLERGGQGLRTTARREGDGWWVVSGEKLWTTNSGGWDGRGADLQCVVCRKTTTESQQQTNHSDENNNIDDPRSSIIILLVTRDNIAQNDPSAYTILDEAELMGFPAHSGPHSKFTNLRIPAQNVLAESSAAADIIEQSFTASAALVGAFSVSIMRAAFDAALTFAKSDSRGGRVPILEKQSVADLLIGIKMRMDASRLLTWKALDSLEKGPGDIKARQELCLEAKVFASDGCVSSVMDAMRVVGVTSYRKDQPFARLLSDASCLPLFDGGNVGVRRRQIEKIFQREEYDSLAAF